MESDRSRNPESFPEEAAERLVTLESRLLAMNARRPDGESLDAISRAVHSIKASAKAFGHAGLGDFARELESAFDGVRNGAFEFNKALFGVLLRGVDALRAHVAALRGGNAAEDTTLASMKSELAASVAHTRRISEGLAQSIVSPGNRVELGRAASPSPSGRRRSASSCDGATSRARGADMDCLGTPAAAAPSTRR